jgi:hypothetical protein
MMIFRFSKTRKTVVRAGTLNTNIKISVLDSSKKKMDLK